MRPCLDHNLYTASGEAVAVSPPKWMPMAVLTDTQMSHPGTLDRDDLVGLLNKEPFFAGKWPQFSPQGPDLGKYRYGQIEVRVGNGPG